MPGRTTTEGRGLCTHVEPHNKEIVLYGPAVSLTPQPVLLLSMLHFHLLPPSEFSFLLTEVLGWCWVFLPLTCGQQSQNPMASRNKYCHKCSSLLLLPGTKDAPRSPLCGLPFLLEGFSWSPLLSLAPHGYYQQLIQYETGQDKAFLHLKRFPLEKWLAVFDWQLL